MKKIQWIIGIIATLVLAYYVITEKAKKTQSLTEESTISSTSVEVKKRFDEKGNLKSDVEMVNGVRNGKAHNYYTDGSLHSFIQYKNNKKEGLSTWYYENGSPYRETLFENDKKQGIQKKYYKSGKLMAEIPYKNDVLQPGTKEYSEMGTLLNKILKLNYKILNKSNPNEPTIIEITGKDIKKVIAYSIFFNQNSKIPEIKSGRDKNAIRFQIPSDIASQNNDIIYIWLTIKTKMNNKKIIEKQLSLN